MKRIAAHRANVAEPVGSPEAAMATPPGVAATFGKVALKAGDDCPKCGGELEKVKHRFDTHGGPPDCSWLVCLDCNYETDPE